MKNIMLLIALCLFALTGISAQKSKNAKLLTRGSWNLEKEDGKTPTKNDRINFVFYKNGTLKLIQLDENKYESGTWNLSADGTGLGIAIKGEPDSIKLKIISISSKNLTLEREGLAAEFVNVPQNDKEQKAGRSKKITGTWQLTERNSKLQDEETVLFQFNADGTAWNTREDDEANWKTVKNRLILTVRGNEESLEYSVSKDKKTLTIHLRSDVLVFKRSSQKMSKPQPKEEEPFVDETVTDENTDITLQPKDLSGTWKVVKMDSDEIVDRTLVLDLKTDFSFTVTENGNVERSGKWELKKGRVIMNDDLRYNTVFSAKKESDGTLILTDYYGKMYLIRHQ